MNRANSFVRERYDAMTKARSIAAIETALREMDAIVLALDRYVAAEEVRTGITDLKHATYSTAAIAARIRSSNLKQSVIELKAKLLVATAEHNSALAKVTALESAKTRLMSHPTRPADRNAPDISKQQIEQAQRREGHNSAARPPR